MPCRLGSLAESSEIVLLPIESQADRFAGRSRGGVRRRGACGGIGSASTLFSGLFRLANRRLEIVKSSDSVAGIALRRIGPTGTHLSSR